MMGDNKPMRPIPTAGTYTYNCAVHGSQMTGRIVVG